MWDKACTLNTKWAIISGDNYKSLDFILTNKMGTGITP